MTDNLERELRQCHFSQWSILTSATYLQGVLQLTGFLSYPQWYLSWRDSSTVSTVLSFKQYCVINNSQTKGALVTVHLYRVYSAFHTLKILVSRQCTCYCRALPSLLQWYKAAFIIGINTSTVQFTALIVMFCLCVGERKEKRRIKKIKEFKTRSNNG